MLCRELGLQEEIARLDQGFDTILNWEGKPLSKGQRQRLQLIKTLASSADVYILDEPTSALNAAWAEKLNDILHELAQEHIVIIITHNQELIRSDDKVIQINQGGSGNEA